MELQILHLPDFDLHFLFRRGPDALAHSTGAEPHSGKGHLLIWQDPLLPHLRGGEAVFYYFISFVGLSHWKVSSVDEGLSFA